MLIGINRDLANKPIGMRTLGLVALGAAIVSLAGVQVEGMVGNPDALSRVVQGIIQGVMAGISFIGAGVILRDMKARQVEGLTTAATVWITAALGIACGLAAWRTVAISVVLALVLLVAGRWAEGIYAAATDDRSGEADR
jgi:putative Mg2+ transporter-C (MgtC) family protein